jgi:maltose O-acetyltransferase
VSGAQRSVISARWTFAVNMLAASPLIGKRRRARILRRHGIDTRTERIEAHCYFHSANVSIGEGSYLNHGVHIENVARVEIGANVAIGMFTVIATSDHEIGMHEVRAANWTPQPVTIGDGCWIGARALILPGVNVGAGCVVAAGSVVTADCEPDGLYAGVPARRVRDL